MHRSNVTVGNDTQLLHRNTVTGAQNNAKLL